MGSKIDIAKAPDWVIRLEGKLHKAALKGLQSAALRTVQHIQVEIIPREERAPVDRGIYRAGWRMRPTEDGALVYNGVPYAGIVEDGAQAKNVKVGKRMIDALAEWVVRKGLVGKGAQGRDGSGKFKSKGILLTEGRRVAWAIAQSMKKKGIFGGKGLKIMAKARLRIPQFIEEEVRREIEKIRE